MRVLVTGATGFLGTPLVEELLERGHHVRAVVRPATDLATLPWGGRADIFVSDLRAAANLGEAFHDVNVVIHLAAATKGSDDDKLLETMVATERLLDAMRGSTTRRVVLVSSVVVYDWTAPKDVLSESCPLEPNIWRRDGYTRAKFFQERFTRRVCEQEGWELTVVRPGVVWGPRARYPLAQARRLGSSHVVLGSKTVLPLTHVVNCVRYMASAAESEGAVGATVNLIDDYELTAGGLVNEYLARSGASGRCVSVPYPLAFAAVRAFDRIATAAFGDDVQLPDALVPEIFAARYRPLRYDPAELIRTLGGTRAIGLEECLEMTFGHARSPSDGIAC